MYSAGKTVISIALVLRGLEEARSRTKGPRQSSATLIVVPSHLIGQWESELKKFTNGLKVFCIFDLKSLAKLTVKELSYCDCVICPVDILESDGYLANVVKTSGSKVEDCPKMPGYAGQKELKGASGVWIPASSADPYGGANSVSLPMLQFLEPIFPLKALMVSFFLTDVLCPVSQSETAERFCKIYSCLSDRC